MAANVMVLLFQVTVRSTILGPGTIFLMLVQAFISTFKIDNWSSFCYNLVPIFIFCPVCYYCKEKTQLLVAGIISAIYGLVMVVVLVGAMIEISEQGWLAPSSLLFFVIMGELVVTSLMHPLEWGCLAYGVIYFVTIPSMYMLLVVFSLFNMNNISWGTRDAPQAVPDTLEGQQNHNKSNQSSNALGRSIKNEKESTEFSITRLFQYIPYTSKRSYEYYSQLKQISSTLLRIDVRLSELERLIDNGTQSMRMINPVQSVISSDEWNKYSDENTNSDADSDTEDVLTVESDSIQNNSNFLVSPNWLHDKDLGESKVEYLNSEEEVFWKQFIEAYLDPIDKDEKQEVQVAKKIKDLRDQYIFKFFMINALFVFIVFLMQINKEILHLQWPLGIKYNITYNSDKMEVNIAKEYLHLEPIGCLFIIVFMSILSIQFVAMLFHRFDTFSHIIANVTLSPHCCNKDANLSEEAMMEQHAEKIKKELQRQIDTDLKLDFDDNSILPPRKRMTVHETIARNERKYSYPRKFSTTIQQNLDEFQKKDNAGSITKKMSQSSLRAIQRRRTTILAEQHQLKLQNTEYGNIYTTEMIVNEKPQHHSRRSSHAYENAAFILEELTVEKI